MSALAERDIAKFLFNPFAVYVADVGESQPATPSFYTEPAMTFNFNRPFVISKTYEKNGGILYTARAEASEFEFRAGFSIKETCLNGLKFAVGGTINSDLDEIILDGITTAKAVWFESCFNDNGKAIRIIIPKAKSIDAVAMAAGGGHVVHPINLLALVDSANPSSMPSIYIEP